MVLIPEHPYEIFASLEEVDSFGGASDPSFGRYYGSVPEIIIQVAPLDSKTFMLHETNKQNAMLHKLLVNS